MKREGGLEEARLDYGETASLVNAMFAFKPNPATGILIRALSRFMRPLEHGSSHGRTLDGEPHHPSWVIAGNLTVFALPSSRYRRKVVLAARLRHRGDINIVEVGRGNGDGKSRPNSGNPKSRRRMTHEFATLDLSTISDYKGRAENGNGLEALVAIQRQSLSPITVVPVARTSHQLTPDAPPASVTSRLSHVAPWNLVRKATSMFRTLRTARVKNCKPLVLSQWLEGSRGDAVDLAGDSEALRVKLRGAVESERRACAGPPKEPVRDVKRRVLCDPILAAYVQEYSLEMAIPREDALGEAQGYIEEIASDYRVGVVRWFARFIDFLFSRFLDGLEIDRRGIRFLSECDSRNRLVLACSHKSYVDPLLIGYAMFRSGMVPPQQAAGLNLDFWPVGWLLRHSGAFYLRRTFRGEMLYREVFSAYVRYLLAENYVTVVYIEGTRSRDGKLAYPRTGYLGILEESLRIGVCSDVTLLPVFLGYDKVPEEGSHVKEMAGGRKVGESVKGFTGIFRSVNSRLGRAYVKFGEPSSMRSLLEHRDVEGVAGVVCEGINKITPLTNRSLAACALLSTGGEWVSAGDVDEAAGLLLRFAARREIPLYADVAGVVEAVRRFVEEGHVVPESRNGDDGYRLEESGRRFLEYNKNTPIHHFIPEALVAASFRGHPGELSIQQSWIVDDVEFLGDVLGKEFVFNRDGEWDAAVERAIGELNRSYGAAVFASLVDSFLEGYIVVATTLGRLEPGSELSRDELVKQCFKEGARLLAEGTIRREESISRVTFKTAIRRFKQMGFLTERRERGDDGKEAVTVSPGERRDAAELACRIRSFLPPA
ncbi:MAG: 1-acyl-sn-glycerol-3-phosphate acyltransferase [Actinobacteria bacterium]|nr:1-acyl-sn-glycerol-3-phosphate acyltransferase [Actinomycetota bacterium]